MLQQFDYVRRCQSQSKPYNRVLIGVLIYTVLRLVMQFALTTGILFPSEAPNSNTMLPDDFRLYLEAVENLQQRENLYPPIPLERMELYQYPPAFALVLSPLSWVSPLLGALVFTLVQVVIYALLYLKWGIIFRRLKLEQANVMLARLLPLWLIFSTFWYDLAYLNIYILMALFGTLVIDAVLSNRPGWAVLWFSLAIHIKPQWALLAVLPLFLGRPRFFFRLVGFSFVAYITIAAATMLVVGGDYGLAQYKTYFELLANMGSGHFPWRGPDMPFLGYNHSIMQIVIYLFGQSAGVMTLALLVKLLALLPLGLIGLRCLMKPLPDSARNSLDAAFAIYLAAFIWLDIVWELALGIAIFTYLLATVESRRLRLALWLIFLSYALVDMAQLMSYLILGDSVIVPGPYVLTDISIYLPVVMMTTLVFYSVLARRLWTAVFEIRRSGQADIPVVPLPAKQN